MLPQQWANTFPDNFTAKLNGSNNFAQINIVVSTQYDEEVMISSDDDINNCLN